MSDPPNLRDVEACGTCKEFHPVPFPYIDGYCLLWSSNTTQEDGYIVTSYSICDRYEKEKE